VTTESLLMPTKQHLYVIGPNPYDSNYAENTKGNGEWSTSAQNMKEALRIIFSTMPFPGEATGRNWYAEHYLAFEPGVSLAGKCSEEVIQVWSNEPGCLRDKMPHTGKGEHLGLLAELDVTKLDDYLTAITALLAAPGTDNAGTALSPLGASVVEFNAQKQAIQTQLQATRFDLQQRQWALEEMEEGMNAQVKELEAKIGLMNAYLRGWSYRTQICTGKTGTGPYFVFQKRQYLAEEIAILANFQRFDFQAMPVFEKWLVKSGQIWKMLPFERCILVTRIRGEKLEYNDPLANLWNNIANMQSIIWIRDGENVVHVDVEYKFDNAVFPNKDEFDRTMRAVREQLWKKHFCPESVERHGFSTDRQLPPVPGQIKPVEVCGYDDKHKRTIRPEDEWEPYVPVRLVHSRFKTLREWLDSDSYTEELDVQLHRAVQDYLRARNKKQLTFCVMLQGIIDNTNLLQVPKGTDVFNWEVVAKYFTLLYDYTHGLPDRTFSDRLNAHFGPAAANVGDWVIAYIDDHPGNSLYYGKPWLLQVVRKGANSYPEVRYHPVTRRNCFVHEYRKGLESRHKEPIRLNLQPELQKDEKHSNKYATHYLPRCGTFFRVPISPDLAARILDDREWKAEHREIVPLLAQYRMVLKTYLVNPKNMREIRLKERHG